MPVGLLKAFLTYHQIYFPKTHNILNLLNLCNTADSDFVVHLEDADMLTDYAVEIRYPDIFFEPDIDDA